MKHFNDQLQPEEKASVRESLMAHMKKNPILVREEGGLRLPIQKPINKGFLYSLIQPSMPTVIVLIIASLTFGSVASANTALPGDVLYPVKIHVNEEVQGWFAVSDKAEARWDSERAERRLKEAETLAVQKKLTAEVEAELNSDFQKHIEEAKKHIAAIKAAGDVDTAASLSSDLDSSLKAHQNIIIHIDSGLLNSLSIKLAEENDDREENNDREDRKDRDEGRSNDDRGNENVTTPAVAEAQLEEATREIAKARKDFAEAQALIDATATANIEAQLATADKSVIDGRAQVTAENYNAALVHFETAYRKAQQAEKFIDTLVELKIDNRGDDNRNDDRNDDTDDRSGNDDSDNDRNDDRDNAGDDNGRDDREELKVKENGSIEVNL
ncbi:hypothetical protein KBD59_01660 [Candidatus Gracilibacteria bacterium]|nr:hypothetical protein [Candidatus Gracilibacteria bacterium]